MNDKEEQMKAEVKTPYAAMRKHPLPDVDYLKKCFSYDPNTGDLVRISSGGVFCKKHSHRYNKPCRSKNAFGYYVINLPGARTVQVSRVAWAIHHGHWPNGVIDHINGIRTDNRICNLRDVSNAENLANRHKAHGNKNGMPIGVVLFRNKKRKSYRVSFKLFGTSATGYMLDEEHVYTARFILKNQIVSQWCRYADCI